MNFLKLFCFFFLVSAGSLCSLESNNGYGKEPSDKVFEKSEELVGALGSSKKLVISLIGTSGAGKGTQGVLLSNWLKIPHISVGDLLREEIRNESKIGRMIKLYEKFYFPEQLADEIPTGILIKKLNQTECSNGYILDGFPRTGLQASIVKNIFLMKDDIHIPIFLNIDEEKVKPRLSKRYVCPNCGHQVREFDQNPWPGFCPIDAGNGKMISLINRPEDISGEELERRFQLFRDNKDKILNTFSGRDSVFTIELNGEQTPQEVFKTIQNEVNKILKQALN